MRETVIAPYLNSLAEILAPLLALGSSTITRESHLPFAHTCYWHSRLDSVSRGRPTQQNVCLAAPDLMRSRPEALPPLEGGGHIALLYCT